MQLNQFEGRVLWLSVWHKDRLGRRNEFLGELLLPLTKVRAQLLQSDLCHSTGLRWYPLNNSRGLQSRQSQQQPVASVNQNKQQQQQYQTTMQAATSMDQPLYCSTTRLQQQQAAQQVARKLSEFERKAQQLAASLTKMPTVENSSHSSMLTLGHSKSGSNYNRINQHCEQDIKLDQQQQQQEQQQQQQQTMISDEIVKNLMVMRAPEIADTARINLGQLFVALKFVPDSTDFLARRSAQMQGQLRVLIKEAKSIGLSMDHQQVEHHQQQQQSLPSPQCKCYLLNAVGQRVGKQKTQQLKRTPNPQWNQELCFNSLKLAQLAGQALEISLINRDVLAINVDLMGGIRLCHRLANDETSTTTDCEQIATEKEAKLWDQMIQRPNIWVFGDLPLRQLRPLVTRTTASRNETQ